MFAHIKFHRLPEPELPILSLFSELVLDSLIIAVVAYGFSLSMAKLIAKKFNYGINGNQELMGEVIHFFLALFPVPIAFF